MDEQHDNDDQRQQGKRACRRRLPCSKAEIELAVLDLQAAINRYLAEHNARPKPFVWTVSAASILAKLDRLPASSV